LKHLLSLLLSILIILATAAALGRLVVARSTDSLKTVVILVDRSASMAAKTGDGPSRLEEAVSVTQQHLAGLPAGIGVIVMAYDRRPEVLLSRSMDRRQVQRALTSIEVRPIEGDPAEALRLARRLAALETPASIWHATDAPPGEEASPEETSDAQKPQPTTQTRDPREASAGPNEVVDVTIEHLSVALKRPVNVGITAFRLRRRPLERAGLDAFVQIHCAGSEGEKVDANLDIELDGILVAPRKLTLQPGGREKLLIPVEAQPDVDRVLTLKLSADGDTLDSDNVVHARIPRLSPAQVLWISESPDPFTELALSSLGVDGDLEMLQGPPSAWPPKDTVDVAIFDGWLPEQWPTDVAVIVVNPPGPLGPVQAVRIRGGGTPLDGLRAVGEGHPVLYGVATGRIALTQTAVIETGGLLDSLWVGPQGPVLLAGEVRGQRVVVMGFSPQHSERLPLMASCPLLIGNAVYWAAESKIESTQSMNRRTGEVVELEGRTLTWEHPGSKDSAETTVDLEGHSAELDRIGLWRTDAGENGSASLLSASDTLVPSQPEDAGTAFSAEHVASPFRGGLAPFLLWGVLGLFIVESWLFHRYLAY
jgi:hypothetical protein